MGEWGAVGGLREGVTGQHFQEENAPSVLSVIVLLPTDAEARLRHRWRDPEARMGLAGCPPCISLQQ